MRIQTRLSQAAAAEANLDYVEISQTQQQAQHQAPPQPPQSQGLGFVNEPEEDDQVVADARAVNSQQVQPPAKRKYNKGKAEQVISLQPVPMTESQAQQQDPSVSVTVSERSGQSSKRRANKNDQSEEAPVFNFDTKTNLNLPGRTRSGTPFKTQGLWTLERRERKQMRYARSDSSDDDESKRQLASEGEESDKVEVSSEE